MSESLPGAIRGFKGVVGAVVGAASSWVDAAAEAVVREGLGWAPAAQDEAGSAEIGPGKRTEVAGKENRSRGEREPKSMPERTGAATPAVGEGASRPDSGSRFADAEEVSWLESGRRELPYRRDHQWAVPQMWWEMALGGIGATTYALSTVAGSPAGMAAGWAVGAGGKGLLLLADLGRPERFPRVFAKPGTSWIARGSWAFGAFAAGGALSLVPCLPRTARVGAAVVADAGAAVLSVYDGLFLNHAKSVASWLPREVPALFAANAVQAGAALTAVLMERPPRWLGPVGAASGAAAAAWGASYVRTLSEGGTAARLSARDLAEGAQRDRFVATGGVIGTALPAVLAVCAPRSAGARAVAAAAACVGVEHVRRAVLQAGIHAPVIDPPRTRPAGEGRRN